MEIDPTESLDIKKHEFRKKIYQLTKNLGDIDYDFQLGGRGTRRGLFSEAVSKQKFPHYARVVPHPIDIKILKV